MMRRRLQKFFPIVLIALAVQILVPIAASWAAAHAASDPLQSVEICHSLSGAPDRGDQGGGDQRAHDGACLICCAAQAAASTDTPQQTAFMVPYRQTVRMAWRVAALDLAPSRVGSNTQARAPPLPM
jgi:hypothetical protein